MVLMRKRRVLCSKIIGETILRTMERVVEANNRIDSSSNGTTNRVVLMLKANNRCKEGEQLALMYFLDARGNVELKVKRVVVRRKMRSLRMMEV